MPNWRLYARKALKSDDTELKSLLCGYDEQLLATFAMAEIGTDWMKLSNGEGKPGQFAFGSKKRGYQRGQDGFVKQLLPALRREHKKQKELSERASMLERKLCTAINCRSWQT